MHYGFMHGSYNRSYEVSLFRHLRIMAYLQLPGAFRSLSRLSSALGAKASTLRSFLLDLFTYELSRQAKSPRRKLAC